MNFKLFLFSIFIVSVFSCKKVEERCSDSPINFSSIEEIYDCGDTRYDLDIHLNSGHLIISNQSDFDTLVSGICSPIIDFSTYDLVIGKKQLQNGNRAISYEYGKSCENNNLRLTATFYQLETSEAPNLTYHALVPKLENGQGLDVLLIIK